MNMSLGLKTSHWKMDIWHGDTVDGMSAASFPKASQCGSARVVPHTHTEHTQTHSAGGSTQPHTLTHKQDSSFSVAGDEEAGGMLCMEFWEVYSLEGSTDKQPRTQRCPGFYTGAEQGVGKASGPTIWGPRGGENMRWHNSNQWGRWGEGQGNQGPMGYRTRENFPEHGTYKG